MLTAKYLPRKHHFIASNPWVRSGAQKHSLMLVLSINRAYYVHASAHSGPTTCECLGQVIREREGGTREVKRMLMSPESSASGRGLSITLCRIPGFHCGGECYGAERRVDPVSQGGDDLIQSWSCRALKRSWGFEVPEDFSCFFGRQGLPV